MENVINSGDGIEDKSLSKRKKRNYEYYYKILKNSDRCEEHNRIEEVIPLKRGTCKFVIFIILNVITVGIINLFIAWFPKLNFYLYYDYTTLEEATHFAILSKAKKTDIVEKTVLTISDEVVKARNSILKRFNINAKVPQIISFEYKLFTYLFSNEKEGFECLEYRIKDTQENFIENYTKGLDENEISTMRTLFGICDIDIKVSKIGTLILDELTDPFYLFQVYSCILWYCTAYELYASVIVVLSIVSLVVSVHGTYTNLQQIQKISKYSCDVNVYRIDKNGELKPTKINSSELVPGDLYEIPEENNNIPGDTILVSGTVILNESILTGESTPVVKHKMIPTENIYDTNLPESDKNILFAGTRITQKRNINNQKVLGVVFQTGFNSFKGNLISNILNPKEQASDFFNDTIKYIVFMGVLCLVGYGISLPFLIKADALSTGELVEKFLDLITTCVSPSLPTCLSFTISYSLSRLKKSGTICIARERMTLAGAVNLIVFDKTGTLTEDHLDIYGFVPVIYDTSFKFGEFFNSCEEYSKTVVKNFKEKLKTNFKNISNDLMQYYIECLACCHCLTYVNNELVGDPIDVKMFEKVGWILQENLTNENGEIQNDLYDSLIQAYVRPASEENLYDNHLTKEEAVEKLKNRYEIGIVRQFDFSSQLQRMTIITKNQKEDFYKVFCKGSPEKIRTLCLKDTIPANFDEELKIYTSQGYRVLGMAAKGLNMDYKLSQSIDRSIVEKNLIFLGFLIVKNKLKEKTISSIIDYDKADIRMVMATGDNILTATSVSRECKLVSEEQEIFSLNLENKDGKETIKWERIEIINENCQNKIQQKENENENVVINTGESEIALINFNRTGSYQKKDYTLELLLKKIDKSLFDLYPAEAVAGSEVKTQENEEKIMKNKIEKNDEKEKKLTLIDASTKYKDSVYQMIENGTEKEEDKISHISKQSKNVNPIEIIEDESPLKIAKNDGYVIAITGNVFERIYNLNEKYKKYKLEIIKNIHDLFRIVLKNGVVFARMSPEDKGLLVESYKKEGLITMMCGDGTNDCNALRCSHVGVSLSKEEASIAGHFTAGVADISSLSEILREGKCSLVTSTQTFKYMILYSLGEFTCVTLMLIFGTYLSDFQFLVVDLFTIFPIEWFWCLTHPSDTLTHHYPIFSLISFPIIISIFFHFVLIFVFQLCGLKIIQKYFNFDEVCDFDDNEDPIKCHENTIIFYIAHYQYIITAIALSVSKPFKKSVFTNWALMIYLVLILFYSLWFTLNCDSWSSNLITIKDLSFYNVAILDENEEETGEYLRVDIDNGKNMKYWVFLIIVINSILHILVEWVIVPLFIKCYERRELRKMKEDIDNEAKRQLKEGQEVNLDINVKIQDLNYILNKKNEKEVPISKYQRIFYHERRIANGSNDI